MCRLCITYGTYCGNKGTSLQWPHEHWPVGIIFFLVTQHPSSSVRTEQRKDPIIYGTTATILPKKNLGNYFYYCTFLPTTTQHHHYSWPYTTVMTSACTWCSQNVSTNKRIYDFLILCWIWTRDLDSKVSCYQIGIKTKGFVSQKSILRGVISECLVITTFFEMWALDVCRYVFLTNLW